jgi:3-oxoacyl-[acyl-carrier protein] reductase
MPSNVRATWLLLKEFGQRFSGEPGTGRIVTLTSDHTFPDNIPYGATKAAADRLTDAAAHELAAMGVTANAINPGPTDTGCMTDEVRAFAASRTPIPRHGQPQDVATLVAFLFSSEGGWITGQLLYGNGGFRGSIP